jgi:hypothetical protein
MKRSEIEAILITLIHRNAPSLQDVLLAVGREHQKIRWQFYHILYTQNKLSPAKIAKLTGKGKGAIKYGIKQYPRRYGNR